MSKKVFIIDTNNKKMKYLSTAWYRILLSPIIDVAFLLLVVSVILFYLNYYEVANLYMGGTSFITYIWVVLAYIAISMIIAIFDLFKFNSLNNTMIVKENNNITIVKGLNNINNIKGARKTTINDRKIIVEINKILDERDNNYKYTDYKNCRLLNETKKYYKYVGEKNGGSSKFKIYKVYSKINLLNKEEN